ncbi:multi-copy leucine-rich repeat protein, putative [Bodo saltans]|uniref:Multi-copy leucine-rich repeat protein, putative n=1 Tax=Bodo saltans TaxID=75058 RepID=A0A0S4JNC9_BODSA|nr:multi-copy leucine-rich repeat protein, putative [Bodo saltans]|eukprot:CUG91402.1 multi-copy leucine-rich repeat protein, putative [Bodo saltans]
MVGDHVKAGDAEESLLHRPLGIFMTFNSRVTPIVPDRGKEDVPYPHRDCASHGVLCCLPPKDYDVSENFMEYEQFATKIVGHCNMACDEDNFDRIVTALRTVLRWRGPMFIAIDEFKISLGARRCNAHIHGLQRVCAYLLDCRWSLRRRSAFALLSWWLASLHSIYSIIEPVRITV